MSQPRGDIRVGDPVRAMHWAGPNRWQPGDGHISFVGKSARTRELWVTVTFAKGGQRDYVGAFIRTDVTRLPRQTDR